MQKFVKYSSIENSYRKKEIDTIIEQERDNGEWCVTEKCHGSNLSLWYDGQKLRVAKRSAFLNEDATGFYNADVIRMEMKPKIKRIWEVILADWDKNRDKYKTDDNPNGELESVVFYGEIFGGVYNHPDVERDHRSTKVQKEVQYSPSNHFYCFDIKINGSFINHQKLETLCNYTNMVYARILFKGTLQECMDYPNDYESTIPGYLGLPAIENNITEGNVIKPVEPTYFWNGSRVILKNKNDKFKEKHDKGHKQPKEKIILSAEAQTLLDELRLYVTENRLRNVLSKIGQITDKQFGLVCSQMNQDVMEDFKKDYIEKFEKIELKERKVIQKAAGASAALLLRKNFLNIIDGEF